MTYQADAGFSGIKLEIVTPNPLINQIMRFVILLVALFISMKSFGQARLRVACVGNSITYGARVENREINSYPAQLAAMLGDGYEVKNFGKNGATLLRKGNLPYWTSDEYKNALAYNPDLVFIKLGTNDTKPVNRVFLNEYINDYKDLIASFQALSSHPRVILLVPVPVFSTDTTGITASVVVKQIIPKVRQVAYETGVEVVNLYNLFIDARQLVPDQVHPNAEGATRIARRLYEFLTRKDDLSFSLIKQVTQATTAFNFHGFQGYDLTWENRAAKIVVPKRAAKGHPWIWRARFWGHEPQADIALLERGFHVVYCDVAEMFGNDESMRTWDSYYQMLTKAGLSGKSAMEGMSRGGVYIYRWAVKYPRRVTCIYGDAPVLDLKSWPGGKGTGKGSAETWEIFKKDFNLASEQEAVAFTGSPVDLTKKIAKGKYPMLHVVGDADDVVPVAENTEVFERKIKDAGGNIKVIHKPGINHHPHSLPNPQAIVDFVLAATK
jgi:lysophospholipase L1-like esterase